MDEKEICMYIAMNLKKKREQMSLTQEEMAKKLDVKISFYTKIDKEQLETAAQVLKLIASKL